MDSHERLIENQRTVRGANERLNELIHLTDGHLVPYICECASIECLGRVVASVSEFVRIHEDRTRYFILPGHFRVDGEKILSTNDRYEIVEKQAA